LLLKHGSVIRLVHVMTGRNLHTHTIPAPITTLNNEVAGYGNATVDDSNSYWMIEVVDDMIRGRRKKFKNINILSTIPRVCQRSLHRRLATRLLPLVSRHEGDRKLPGVPLRQITSGP
jgi:dolichyl-phosphate-mannose-protein mannosyltransferase